MRREFVVSFPIVTGRDDGEVREAVSRTVRQLTSEHQILMADTFSPIKFGLPSRGGGCCRRRRETILKDVVGDNVL
jgi:hypothetical protein